MALPQIPAEFGEHSGNISHRLGNVQGTFSEHSGNIQGTFGERSGNIQGTFGEHSGNIQGTFREHSGNIQGTHGRIQIATERTHIEPGTSVIPIQIANQLDHRTLGLLISYDTIGNYMTQLVTI
jgi:hypothetical protein